MHLLIENERPSKMEGRCYLRSEVSEVIAQR
jgi:hypothetical protein